MNDASAANEAIELHDDQVAGELTELVERLVDEAQRQGAHETSAAVSDSISVDVSARERDIENVSYEQGRAFRVSVFVDKREGTAVTSDVSDDAIKDTVAQALSIASYTEVDPCSGLPDKNRLAVDFPNLEQNFPKPVDMDQLKASALELDTATLDHDPRIMPGHGASASQAATCIVQGNSLGFLNASRYTVYSRSASALVKSDAGMQTDYWFDSNCQSDQLESASAIGKTAAERALKRLDPQPIKTGTYPVLYDQWMAPSLLMPLIEAISGGSLYRQESYLVDSINTQVATADLTLTEYPQIARRIQSRNCDGDGVAKHNLSFIEKGHVSSYLLGTYAARQLKLESTGHAGGVSNVHVETTFVPVADLLAEVKEGFFVTSLIGSGTNLLTGEYSRGAAGFWIENGELAYPVDNVTIASNLDQMYKGIVGFGDDLQDRGTLKTGSILVDAMTVASNAYA